MAAVQRPGPPIRSYTETVQDDVDDATSSLLFSAPSARVAPQRQLGETQVLSSSPTEHRVRRRRSTLDLRLPPAIGGHPAKDVGRRDGGEQRVAGGSGGGEGQSGEDEGAAGRPAFQLRRTTSAELLVRDEAADEEDDEDFSSDDESFRFRPPSVASTATSQRSSRRGVRVQDWTERPSGSFVRDVRITGYHAVGSESGGFVVFDIEIDTLPVNATSQSTTIRIHRRYSAFARLRSDLLYAHPRFRNIVPRLPPKSSLAKYRPSFLERRRQRLAFFLATILLHPILGGDPIVRQWVLE
ncbi:Phox homologous domain-containing protein [Rhodotorula toruloides]|uniref:Endosomal/vacuolar adapter protein YPT35 n=1 Tax=Rhodotorula toruloides TaxID=5286 RepID=A0A2T0AHT2_RHOTO|nr:Phox homologous domain-containing protein [Rhodotorula toruloides]